MRASQIKNVSLQINVVKGITFFHVESLFFSNCSNFWGFLFSRKVEHLFFISFYFEFEFFFFLIFKFFCFFLNWLNISSFRWALSKRLLFVIFVSLFFELTLYGFQRFQIGTSSLHKQLDPFVGRCDFGMKNLQALPIYLITDSRGQSEQQCHDRRHSLRTNKLVKGKMKQIDEPWAKEEGRTRRWRIYIKKKRR